MKRNLLRTCILVLAGTVAISCGSSRNIAYLQDVTADDVTRFDEYTNIIKPGDMLSIVVSSSRMELAVPFNLYSVRSQMSAMGQSASARQELEGYTVNPDGDIDFPTLGTIHVAGLTRNQLVDLLKSKLVDYMPDPIVTITFLNFNITVVGEVASPGNFSITGDRVSIFAALGMAGDLTEFGNREEVLVIRENAGERTIGRLNLKSKKIFDSPYYYLQQNDVVCVEPINARARGTSFFQMNLPTVVSIGSLASSVAMLIFYITTLSR